MLYKCVNVKDVEMGDSRMCKWISNICWMEGLDGNKTVCQIFTYYVHKYVCYVMKERTNSQINHNDQKRNKICFVTNHH